MMRVISVTFKALKRILLGASKTRDAVNKNIISPVTGIKYASLDQMFGGKKQK